MNTKINNKNRNKNNITAQGDSDSILNFIKLYRQKINLQNGANITQQ